MEKITDRECQEVLEQLVRHEHLTRYEPKIGMRVKLIRAGHASWTTNQFTVPRWALNKGREYAIYYVVHEFAHIVHHLKYWTPDFAGGHSKTFKRIETRLLKLFDLQIGRAKTYPLAIYANGEKVYQRKANDRKV